MDRLDALEQRVAELERRLAQADFSFTADDVALVEITPGSLRVREDPTVTRQPPDLKDSVTPWWRSQWEEGV